jgi:long-subunit fatty acid transport protein
VDTTAGANGAVTGYQSLVPLSTGVNQIYDASTRGSFNELAFGWAGNKQDKLYLGASIIMPFMNYERQISYSETDVLNNPNNQFGGFIFNEYFSSKAWGLGAKFGVIYKPVSYLRLGFAIQTPQILTFRDQISADMTTNTEDYAGLNSASSDQLNDGFPGIREYTMATPTRVTLSTSYFFASPNKPSQPLGFISADLEIVNYAGTRYFSNTYDDASTEYYNALNSTIKAVYKNNVNLKLGSELRLNTNWMVRAGTAFYGSPYKDESIKASIWTISGGLGYRTSRHFIDFTVVNTRTNDAVFPYRLNDKPNTYANFTGNRLQYSIGFGIRF